MLYLDTPIGVGFSYSNNSGMHKPPASLRRFWVCVCSLAQCLPAAAERSVPRVLLPAPFTPFVLPLAARH